MIPFVDFRAQFAALERELRAAMDRVFARGWYVLGEEGAAFESEFAAYLGVARAVGVASGTDAIHLALRAAGVGPGSEVITVANTCVPTVAAIEAAGARPVLVDACEDTLTLDPAQVDAAITPATRAIVPVHLYGHPCDMDPLLDLARAHGLAIVEDCAQAHGARYRNRLCGTLGTAAAFSFYPTKNLGAFGDGGAVATDDPAVADRVRMLRNYGERARYDSEIPGFNSRLDELQAAILRVKLAHLDAWNEARRARAHRYGELLEGLPLRLPVEMPWARHVYHLYVVRTEDRDALQAHLQAHGIVVHAHYPRPVHFNEAYAHLGYCPGAFPVAERACREVLSLPLYPELPMDAVEAVARAVRDHFA